MNVSIPAICSSETVPPPDSIALICWSTMASCIAGDERMT